MWPDSSYTGKNLLLLGAQTDTIAQSFNPVLLGWDQQPALPKQRI